MCAIAGMLGIRPRGKLLEKMLETMHRRGPDDRGIFWEGGCTLLHSRLSIIDPEGGSQPMHLTWGEQELTLVYNGELYNTEEVRKPLEAQGHRFLGHSDTEVVLHAYAQYGAECLSRFNGIFAFAVWDSKRRRLFLARDRIGVKPLFYTETEGQLVFASEMKTLFAAGVPAQLDENGAAQLLLLGPGRLPGSGVFRNIRELEPGCWGLWEQGRSTVTRYWHLTDREHTDTFPQTVERVRFLVTDAIRRQLVSDVPIGTFLSGGLDSSLISAVCAETLGQQGKTLQTFSVDYRDNDRYFVPGKFQPNADTEYMTLMARYLKSDHHLTVLTPEQLENALEPATIARDLPGMADVDFSLLVFCGYIRTHVKAALSGECADEIFGGYPWYRDPEVRSRAGFPWAQNTDDRAGLLLHPVRASEFVMDAYTDTCRSADILPGTNDTERRMKEMMNLNFRWFMQTLLDRKDRMSMYHGLEVRVPFCDYRIAQYLYGVPWEMKNWQGQEKGLLREAAKGLLPEAVRTRKKSPYPKTFDPEYEQRMARRMRVLLAADSPLFSLVNREALKAYFETDHLWPWYGQLMRRPQTMAYFLQLDCWLRRYRVELVGV